MTPNQVKAEYRKRINLLKSMCEEKGYKFSMHGRYNHCHYNFELEFEHGGGSMGYALIQWAPCQVQSYEEDEKGYKIAADVEKYVISLFPYANTNHFRPFYVDMRIVDRPNESCLIAP